MPSARKTSRKQKRASLKRKKSVPGQEGDGRAKSVSKPVEPITRGAAEHNQQSLLLRFPNEILVHILGFVLAKDEPVLLHSRSSRKWRNEIKMLRNSSHTAKAQRVRSSDVLNIFLTSRAFYFASIDAYYAYNVLYFQTPPSLVGFIERMESDRRQCITRLRLDMKWIACPSAEPRIGGNWEIEVEEWDVVPIDTTGLDEELLSNLPQLKELQLVSSVEKLDPWLWQPFVVTSSLKALEMERVKFKQQIVQTVETWWPTIISKVSFEFEVKD